jgi:hypothetical protein
MIHTLTITERDLISAQRLHATPAPWLWISLLTSALLVIAYCYVQDLLSFGSAVGALVGLFGWLVLLFFAIIPYRARRIYRQQKNLHRKHEFSWNEQFIHFHAEDYDGKIRWTDVMKARENRAVLLLYYSDSLFNLFPKHCFPSPEIFEEFRSHVASAPKG